MDGNKNDGQKPIRQEVKEKTVGYITAALSFVAALAWNEAIKALIDQFIASDQNSLAAKFMYAIIVTIIVVMLAVYLAKLSKK